MGFVYAITAAIAWGLAYTLDQKLLVSVSPAYLLFVNALLTLLITLPLILYNGEIKTISHIQGETFYLIIISQLLILFAGFLILFGIRSLGAPTASIFEIMYPIFVIFFSFILFGHTFNYFFWMGAILIFLGSLTIVLLG